MCKWIYTDREDLYCTLAHDPVVLAFKFIPKKCFIRPFWGFIFLYHARVLVSVCTFMVESEAKSLSQAHLYEGIVASH
jgi:hypothetical protein